MALFTITILLGLSLLSAWVLFKVVIYEVPQGRPRLIVDGAPMTMHRPLP